MGENRLKLHAEGSPKDHPFVYDSFNPDIWQARQSAYEWHGRLWSPHLYCYASLGCRIADEDFREGLIKEITFAVETVEANPSLYESDEPAKLENLRRCVEVAKANGPGEKGNKQSRKPKGGEALGSSRFRCKETKKRTLRRRRNGE